MPKLRFKGFMDDWEQRKLGDVCCFINGDRSSNYPSTADFIDSGIPFVGSDALGETLVNKTKLRYISREKYQQMNGLKIEIDDVLYTLRGAGFGKCSIADFSNGTVASSCVGIRCTEELDAKFLVQWLSSPSADNEKNMAVNGSTAQNISVEDMKNYVICAPGLDEQKKVSAQLYTLDKLITLHQRKCDELQKVKKYMLQKMFPKKGEKVPEIRFAGFTGDWVQWKLGDLGSIQTCKRIFKEQTSEEGEIPFYKNGTIGLKADAFISRELFEEFKRLYPYPEVGDILISAVGSVGRTAEYTGADEYFQDSNVVWLHTDGRVDKKYLKVYYQVIDWLIEGSTVKHLYNDNILRSSIKMPVNLDEQRKIGLSFEELDNLITLHQRKHETLKEIKKYMLQNMFPKK